MRDLHKFGLLMAVSLLSQAALVAAGDNSSSSGTHKSDKKDEKKATSSQPSSKNSDQKKKSDGGVLDTVKKLFDPSTKRGASALKEGKLLDITEAASFNFCYASSPTALTLWHPNAHRDTNKLLLQQQGGEQFEGHWTDGQQTFAWQADQLKIVDGATYRVTIGQISNRFTLHQLPDQFANQTDQATWMAEQGCYRQAALLAGIIK